MLDSEEVIEHHSDHEMECFSLVLSIYRLFLFVLFFFQEHFTSLNYPMRRRQSRQH